MKIISYQDLKHCIKRMFLGKGGVYISKKELLEGIYIPEWGNDWSIRYRGDEEIIEGEVEQGIIPESELIKRLQENIGGLDQMGSEE